MDFQEPPQPEPSQTKGYVIAVIICIVVGVLYYWLSPYFYMIVEYIDAMKSMIDLLLSFSNVGESEVGESEVYETPEKTKPVSKPKEKKAPAPDDSTSSVQSSPTSNNSQYCYVGEWKGIRSCAKVGKSSCKGQTYSTEELCVNPNLRP
jgi:hypothetical protein